MSIAALDELIERKRHTHDDSGFAPVFMPSMLFDFQKALVEWSVRKGRAAIFADCGLGKSAMEMTFAQNVVEKTNRRVLVLTPLAVAPQMVAEAAKFGIEAERSSDGKAAGNIVVANYERLHHFDPADFVGLVCDESSILKNCDGVTRAAVTDFARKMSYRLLCTATPSPNDLIELRSNPGEVVLTPFMGVGSEVYQAVRMGRRGIGAELKESYFRQAVKNVAVAEAKAEDQGSLFKPGAAPSDCDMEAAS